MKLGRREREAWSERGVRVVDLGALERNLVRTIDRMLERGELTVASPDFYAARARLFGGGLSGGRRRRQTARLEALEAEIRRVKSLQQVTRRRPRAKAATSLAVSGAKKKPVSVEKKRGARASKGR